MIRLEDVQRLAISPQLRLALSVVARLVGKAWGESLCVARPEMFTGGASRQWLDQRLGGIREHISLSDGSAVKLLSGMRNQLFLYGLGDRANYSSFLRLVHWTPELFLQFAGQINTFYRFGGQPHGEPVVPAKVLMLGGNAAESACLSFYLDRNSLESSVEKVQTHGAVKAPSLPEKTKLIYIPLTECALHDRRFCSAVAAAIAFAYFHPEHRVMICLPQLGNRMSLAERLLITLAGIREGRVILPRAFAQNILLLPDDPDEAYFEPAAAGMTIMLHETFEFWRHSEKFYKSAAAGVQYFRCEPDEKAGEWRLHPRPDLIAPFPKLFGRYLRQQPGSAQMICNT